MAIVSAGYAGTVNDAQWALMSRFFGQDFGILNLTELACTQQSGTKSFNLSPGTLYGRGVMDVSDTSVSVSPTVPVSGGQWFLVVARRVWATKETSLIAVAGATTSATPPTARPSSYPTLQRTPGVQDDQPLWWVWVNASNTTTVMFDQRIFSSGRVANFSAIPPVGFLTRGSQLTVESVRLTLADNGTAWLPITMRVSGTTAQRTEFTNAGLAIDGMEWHDTTDNRDYDRRASGWVASYLRGSAVPFGASPGAPVELHRLEFRSGRVDANTSPAGVIAFSFTPAFPNACLALIPMQTQNTSYAVQAVETGQSASGGQLFFPGAASVNRKMNWLALGY